MAKEFQAHIKQLTFSPDKPPGQPLIVIVVTQEEASEALLCRLDIDVRTAQGLDFDVVVSSASAGLYILILPPGAGKGVASVHVADRLGFPPDRVVVAGDGANDVPLFEATAIGVKGVVVGSSKELRSWVEVELAEGVYIAQRKCAYGLLEGLNHHHRRSGDGTSHAAGNRLLPGLDRQSPKM